MLGDPLPIDVRGIDLYSPTPLTSAPVSELGRVRRPGTPLSIDYNSAAPTRAEFEAVKTELAAFKLAFRELNQWLVALIAAMPAAS
jgi:hypothetical protein